MKNKIGIFVIFVAVMSFISCEPVEHRQEMTGKVTDAEIAQYVKIEQEIRDGKKSNFFSFKTEGMKALLSFQHGLGIQQVSSNSFVQCFVVPGDQEIVLTILNPDGSLVENAKTYSFTVEECFDVDPAWALFCGSGSKTWTWDNQVGDPYGMGGANDATPGWWCPAPESQVANEGKGATMTLSAKGATLTKERTNGTEEKGFFSFDMDARNPRWSRPIGSFTTRAATILAAMDTGGNGLCYTVDILTLTEDELVFGKLVPVGADGGEPDAEGWGQCNFWMFREVK